MDRLPGALRPERVLLVDADAPRRRAARESLLPLGLEVLEAEDAAHALALSEQRPSLLLVDAQMADADAGCLIETLRRQPDMAEVPVLLTSAPAQGHGCAQALARGADEVLVEPVDPLVLARRSEALLELGRCRLALAHSQRQLADLQRMARIVSWECDAEGGDFHGSPALRDLLGLFEGKGPVPRSVLAGALHPQDRGVIQNLLDKCAEGSEGFSVDTRVLLPDDGERVVHWQAEVAKDRSGRPLRVTGTVQDVTERKRTEQQVDFLAYHDGLTGLANRNAFLRQLRESVRDAAQGDRSLALLVMDLDNFKRINDTLGHDSGDLMLQGVAERLERCLGQLDERSGNMRTLCISRLGEDEFTVLLSDLSTIQDAARAASRILDSLREPFIASGRELLVGASIGIALYPADGDDVDTLLRSAEEATQQAKAQGRNHYQFFTSSVNESASRRFALERRLCRAFESHELRIFYQPQVDMGSGQITGVEALLRWTDADFGVVSPAEFIPLAEDAGLITPIGEWVLRSACWQVKAWQEAGLPPVRLAVNLSPHHFEREGLLDTVNQALFDTGLAPSELELEITENALMQNQEDVVAILRELKQSGISVSLDDFGTGYSSLSYLKRFPVNAVKIDRSFVRDLTVDPDDAAITAAIISMAKALRLRVIAEGVETEKQKEFLRARGCDDFQGYLYSPPVDATEMARLLGSQ